MYKASWWYFLPFSFPSFFYSFLNMSDKNRKSSQFIPSWPNSHAPKVTPESTKSSSIHEESLELVSFNDLQQGELYIIKIKLIAIALFQGE